MDDAMEAKLLFSSLNYQERKENKYVHIKKEIQRIAKKNC